MHVDGFRFDLASALARGLLRGRPALPPSSSWCNRTRWCPRSSSSPSRGTSVPGRRSGGQLPSAVDVSGTAATATRCATSGGACRCHGRRFRRRGLTASADLYETSGRRPHASINFVTAHDGFTLHDLVSYNGKHNAANGEDNRDGSDDNRSWNCGDEGPTDDADVHGSARAADARAADDAAAVAGRADALRGDELGRTQGGNNNAYCQDNELSWVDWTSGAEGHSLTDFTRGSSWLAPRPPGVPAPPLLPGPLRRGHPRHRGPRLVHPRRATR